MLYLRGPKHFINLRANQGLDLALLIVKLFEGFFRIYFR
jgi:hypothetical protein